MKVLTLIAISSVCAFVASVSHAQGHVNLVRSLVPYGGDVKAFCERGYPAHNWAPLIPSMGRWIVIIPNKPVNYQYIQSYEIRCYSGGMIR